MISDHSKIIKMIILGYRIRINSDKNEIIIYDYKNKLKKTESLEIMNYLDDEGFLDEYEFDNSKPLLVKIFKIKNL